MLSYFNSPDINMLLEQSIFNYEHHKYAACCATTGVLLEEICACILIEQGKTEKELEKTTLYVLIGQLRTLGVITRREVNQLVAASMIRNSASHQATGYIVEAHCDILYTACKSVFTYYMNFMNQKNVNEEGD